MISLRVCCCEKKTGLLLWNPKRGLLHRSCLRLRSHICWEVGATLHGGSCLINYSCYFAGIIVATTLLYAHEICNVYVLCLCRKYFE